MHSVTEVIHIIGQMALPLPMIRVPLRLAAGCVLAEAVKMDLDSPPFDRCMLDGYAVRAVDTLEGAQLRIIGRQDAGGAAFTGTVTRGTCVAINTGAPVPAGADAILMVEHTEQSGEFVTVRKSPAAGWGTQRRGADAARGQTVLEAGTLLGPVQIAVAAAAGVAEIAVIPRPRVAVLSTGDELVPPERVPAGGQIRNSNGPMLAALAQRYAVLAGDPQWAPDDPAPIRSKLLEALAGAEVVLVTGSLSMGTRDFVPAVLQEMGFTTHVQTVKIKPGKPFVLATKEERWGGGSAARRFVIGLPGNPVSGFVCFHRFVRPLLARLAGGAMPETGRALCDQGLVANGDREFYQPARLDHRVSPLTVSPLNWRGSADIYTLAKAQALIVHPVRAPLREAGTVVDIIEL